MNSARSNKILLNLLPIIITFSHSAISAETNAPQIKETSSNVSAIRTDLQKIRKILLENHPVTKIRLENIFNLKLEVECNSFLSEKKENIKLCRYTPTPDSTSTAEFAFLNSYKNKNKSYNEISMWKIDGNFCLTRNDLKKELGGNERPLQQPPMQDFFPGTTGPSSLSYELLINEPSNAKTQKKLIVTEFQNCVVRLETRKDF